MPKLHLKRTPEEAAARRLRRKERKEQRKRRRRDETEANYWSSKRHRTESTGKPTRKWASSDEDYFSDKGCHSYKHKQDYDTIQEEVEERLFREKMFGAMEDEDRLDSIESRLNDYAHVPGRWRRGGSTEMGIYAYEELEGMADCACPDPFHMDDEEYAEWIRMGMHRLKHAEEYAEQQRRKAAHAVRVAEEKKRKVETAKLERQAAEERKRKRREREEREWTSARQQYEQRWNALLSDNGRGQISRLAFVDIPWPILNAYRPEAPHISLGDLTQDAIRNFLVPLRHSDAKEKRDKLREAMLRFHPDKFEGRIMKLVSDSEQASVREGIAQVVRVVNGLLAVMIQ